LGFFSGSLYALLEYGNKLLFFPVAVWFGVFLFTIFFTESKKVRDSGEIPQQQSNLRDDATKPPERQTAPEEVAVRKEQEKPDEAPAEVGEHAPESAAGTMKVRLCGNCGSTVTSNSKVCKWCGAGLK
jgi:hypothetical protein